MTRPRIKKTVAVVTLQLDAGQASMAKLGQNLGQFGLNLVELVRRYNDATGASRGEIIPAVITVYEDRSFALDLKSPPTSALLRAAAGVVKGAGSNGDRRVGSITTEQLRAVAERKLPDLNTVDLEAAMRSVAGTARSMGIVVTG